MMIDYLQPTQHNTFPKIAILAREINGVHFVKVKVKPLQHVIDRFCRRYNIQPSIFFNRSRKREIVLYRQKLMWLCRGISKQNDFCYPQHLIGKMVGNFDHATVLHSWVVINNLIATDKEVRKEMMHLTLSFNINIDKNVLFKV